MLANTDKKHIIDSDQDAIQRKISEAEEVMRTMPQLPAMETTHFFINGMYCRRIEIPKDSIIVSKVHKTEHFFVGCVGRLVVAGQGDDYILEPGNCIPSEVGTRRMVVALDDVVCMTIHKTDVNDVDKLEAELMVDDPLALYDVNNKPKPGVIVMDEQNKLKGEN